MTEVGGELKDVRGFKFLRGGDARSGELTWPDGAEVVRKSLAESMNAKNVAFLLGAGCSSSWSGGHEVGIPTMAPLAKEFTKDRDPDDPAFPTKAERTALHELFGIEIGAAEYSRNLERLMELLFSMRFVLKRSSHETAARGPVARRKHHRKGPGLPVEAMHERGICEG